MNVLMTLYAEIMYNTTAGTYDTLDATYGALYYEALAIGAVWDEDVDHNFGADECTVTPQDASNWADSFYNHLVDEYDDKQDTTNYSIPPEVWFVVNVAGSATNSPAAQLLSADLDILSSYQQSGTLAILTMDDATSTWWSKDKDYGNDTLFTWWSQCARKFISARDEDIRLGIGFDILQKYAERISTYAETAIDGLTTEDGSESSALEILISELSETTPGRDVLSNLTPLQLMQKSNALERQAGDPDLGYISKSETFSSNDYRALDLMLGLLPLTGDEGRNIKTSLIGMPASLFANVAPTANCAYFGPTGTAINSIHSKVSAGKNSSLFGLKASATMPDYPLFSLVPKIFRFDYELFVLPDAFDNIDFDSVYTWEQLVDETIFTRQRFLVVEGSPGTSEALVKIDQSEKEIYGVVIEDPDNVNLFDIYSNTLASYLLEKYYKLVGGVGMGDDDFCTAGSGLEIPINDYAIDFAGALSSIYTDLESGIDSSKIDSIFMASEDIESVSYNTLNPSAASNSSVASYSTMVSTFSTEIAAGEFGEVEATLFESFTNAASSRLFSAESMRDKIIGAKYFDRIFYVLTDPDEFAIASQEEYQADKSRRGGAANLEVMEVYRSTIEKLDGEGEIIPVAFDSTTGSPTFYKVVSRKDEGHMSFGGIMWTVVRENEGSTTMENYEVVLRSTEQGSLMVNDYIVTGVK